MAGQAFVLEDDDNMPVANVLSGQLKVSRALSDGRTQLMRLLRPGDFMPGGHITSGVTITALTASSLCVVPRHLLDELARKHPALEKALRTELETEIADAQDHLMALGRMTAVERVANFFLRERTHAARLGENTDPFTLYLTRAEIADYLGLTTETVSRVITRLKNAGLLRFEPGRIARANILDLDRLAALAGLPPPAREEQRRVTLSQLDGPGRISRPS